MNPLFPPQGSDLRKRAAEARRNAGAERSAAKADSVDHGWRGRADGLLDAFSRIWPDAPFLAEDFVAWCAGQIAPPPDGRAWGAVLQRSARKGRIVRVGYAPANTSNRSPKCLWKRNTSS